VEKTTEKIREKYKPDKVLETWASMMQALPYLNEAELEAAVIQEAAGEKRSDVIVRLHRRFTRIRQRREFQELTK
jgi:hypothetical protein